MPMLTNHLLPWLSYFRLDTVAATEHQIVITLTANQGATPCPLCGQSSRAIHSSYHRTVADLAWAQTSVRLSITTRRFFCRNRVCDRRIFTERFPATVAPSARRSGRLAAEQRQLVLELGGAVSARISTRQGMPVSPRTMVRLAKRTPHLAAPTPRMLGVDDFAFRKGQTYGTLLVDLERHQPIDMLPDRSAASLATWLKQHPGVAVITRDRGAEYIEGATQGAPQAMQVADRFHLLQNLREATQRVLEGQSSALAQAAQPDVAESAALPASPVPDVPASPPPPIVTTRAEQARQQRRANRLDRYHAIQALHTQGYGIRAIARQLSLSRKTVRRMVVASSFPERGSRRSRPSKLDTHADYLHAQLRLGHDNAFALWQTIRDQHGYTGSRALVSGWVARHRQESHPHAQTPKNRRGRPPATTIHPPVQRRTSARQAAWLLIQPPDDLEPDDRQLLNRLIAASEALQIAYPLVQEFRRIVRERHPDALDSWIQRATASGIAALRSFAAGLQRDYAAVRAALSTPLSNGQVEGQINRLKYLKRAGYGRASFELLRLRVLTPSGV